MFRVEWINRNPWLLPSAATACLFGILLFLFPFNSGDSSINSPLGFALWSIWTSSGTDTQDHTYCLLVPLMLGYLIYEKGAGIVRMTPRPDSRALVAIGLGLVLFWIGSRAGKQYIGCASIQLLLFGVINWFWGGAVFRRLMFAWAIVCFAWPLPFFDTAVAFPLRMIVSHTAYHTLNVIGIATIQDGTALLSAATPGQPEGARFQIDIADPCSGLHSLLPLLMFSSFYCYFFFRRPWQRWTVFLSAVPFTIAGNVVRILLLVIGCLLWGSTFAIGPNDQPSAYHEACGFVVFVVVLGFEYLFGVLLVLATHRWSRNKNAAAPSKTPPPAVNPATLWQIPAWRSGVLLGFAALVLVVFLISPPVYLPSEAGVLMALPEQVTVSNINGGHFYGDPAPVSEVEHRMLPKDTEFSRKTYNDFHDHSVFFSIVLSGVQQYTIHPPEICLVAQGWTIVSHEDIPIHLKSGHGLIVRNLSLQRDAVNEKRQHIVIKAYYMYWYVADNLTTPSHAARNWISSWDRVVHNRDHRWAYVIAMAPITQTLRADGLNAEETRVMLMNFIREIVPTFQKMNSAASPLTPDRAGKPTVPAPAPEMRLDRYDNSDFDRGAGTLKEALWVLCKCTFFLNPFPWPSPLRVRMLRIFGAKIGSGVVIRSGVNITFPWRFVVGNHVWIGDDVLILSLAPVTLGSQVCLSQRSFLCTGSHDWRRETFDLQTKAIDIEDSVWISAQAFIGPGVRVGRNSLVSAGAVVMKAVPPHSMVKGNPAIVTAKID